MTAVLRHAVFLVIDDEVSEAQRSFQILKPYLSHQKVEIADARFVASVKAGCNELKKGSGHDIVLLDIKGVDDDGLAIESLRTVNPYVPIVMMSNQYSQEKLLEYLDRGARTFIWKVHLIPDGGGSQSGYEIIRNDSQDRENKLEKFSIRLRKIIDDYRPTKNILNRAIESGGVVIKEDVNSPEVRLQVDYLQLLNGNQQLEGIFPKVNDEVIGEEKIEYKVPYYDLKTLRNVILEGSEEEPCEYIVCEATRKVLHSMISKMYLDTMERNFDVSLVQEIGINRISRRLEEAGRKVSPSKEEEPIQTLFLKLLNQKTFPEARGRKYAGVEDLLDKLRADSDFNARMIPPWISRIHGDLHFNNIMVDDRLPKAVRFRLIDPKGTFTWKRLGLSDPAYDFGKLFQSTSGLYDLIDVGYLRADFTKAGLPPLVPQEWVNSPLSGGRSGAKVTTRRQSYRPWTRAVFERTSGLIEQVINNSEYAVQDPDWLIRARFYEAAHMLSCTPFHLPDFELAAAAFIRGVELLNAFVERYSRGGYPDRALTRTTKLQG